MYQILSVLLFLIFIVLSFPKSVSAIVNPLSFPNNKFGIHIISATVDEASPAADLVNSSGGDWGYITVLVESKDRNHDKWQKFFNNLRQYHLIPILRLATQPEGSNWKLPYEGEEIAWADFLDNLIWPTKNRYVVIYNEPNQGQEWAGKVDARSYAQVLDKTITALKNKNPDFFVLNAGFDASAPNKPPLFADELSFLKQMDEEVPGIFNKLDGWTSHSYPNPGFKGSPDDQGRGTIETWIWELQQLKSLGVNKSLPVFITETGWKHAEGKVLDKSLPTPEVVGKYLEKAFTGVWNNSQIVAVTPFLLNYQEPPFDHFSFKKLTGEHQNLKILGASYPEYYSHYQAMLELPKNTGRPIQENKAELIKGGIYYSLVGGEKYIISITFKNTGQSIWNEYGEIELKALEGQQELKIEPAKLSSQKITPGEEATFNLRLQAPNSGTFKVSLQLFIEGRPFNQEPLVFATQVKAPVDLIILTSLPWKKSFAGNYLFSVSSEVGSTKQVVELNNQGKSDILEAKYLLPDYNFKFTLSKPFYKAKTIEAKVKSGVNKLNFGSLEPDFLAALLKPKELWKLLPFSH